jgi:hypothetical protein
MDYHLFSLIFTSQFHQKMQKIAFPANHHHIHRFPVLPSGSAGRGALIFVVEGGPYNTLINSEKRREVPDAKKAYL